GWAPHPAGSPAGAAACSPASAPVTGPRSAQTASSSPSLPYQRAPGAGLAVGPNGWQGLPGAPHNDAKWLAPGTRAGGTRGNHPHGAVPSTSSSNVDLVIGLGPDH